MYLFCTTLKFHADKSGITSITVTAQLLNSLTTSCIRPVGRKYVKGGYSTSASPGNSNEDRKQTNKQTPF